jgi:hypothetical protein
MFTIRRRVLAVMSTASIVLVLSVLAVPAAAQQQLGAIQGTITDQTHAVLPGVTVTVTNADTGVSRTTTTNETGVYRMPSLDPGRYSVKAELQAFRSATQTDLTLSVGATLGVNVTLNAGAVEETIQVTAVAPDIQTEKADVSAVVEQKKIVDLPLVGRNVLSLAALQPGINGIPGTTDFLAAEQGMGITANGVRESGNNASIDGASINNGPWGGTMILVPNVEAVQEFQVIANNPSAEYGRNSGAMVSVITKGGTNVFRGSGFEFHRDQGLRSKGFFETAKAPFRRNDYGGSFGGPIKKDNTFFFASFEGVREQIPNSFTTTVETKALVEWATARRPSSIAAQLFRKYAPSSYPTTGFQDVGGPLPGANVWSTTPDGIPDIGTINVTTNGSRRGDQFNGRFDQVLHANRDRLRATYYLSRSQGPFLYTRAQFNHPYPFRDQLLNLAHTTIVSNSTLNEVTVGYLRQDGHAEDVTPDSPTISFANGQVPGFGVEFWHPIEFTQNNLQLKDTVTLNRGTHSFRTGGEARLGRDGATLHHWERPNYNFQSILDFIDDEPFSETRAVNPATGQSTTAYGKYITNEWSLFIQDNWKVRSNLTLNLGLRYDNFGNPHKDQIPFNGIILGSGSTIQQQIATAKVGTIDQLFKTDWNNFSPRFGITWDPASSGTLVFRAGGGKSYNRINNTVFSDERLNPPQFAQAVATVQDANPIPLVYSLGPTYTPNPALGRGLDANGGIKGARVALRVVDPNIVTPEYYNWFAGVQRQLPGHFVIEANYNGSKGRHLLSNDGPTSEDYNRFSGDLLDGRRDRLNPSFASVDFNESRVASNYQGMSLQLLRRYAKGFSFQAAYTYGILKDTPFSSMEVTRPDLDYSYANLDIRHKLAMNFIVEIPYAPANPALKAVLGGWQVNGIAILQSGAPFTVICTQAYPRCDFNADGANNDRLNLPSFGTNLGDPNRQKWLTGVFTAADFTFPATGTFDTEPRNAFRGPGFKNLDFSLFKNFDAPGQGGRRSKVQVRLEAFNISNWVNLNNPSGSVTAATFGRVTSARGGTGGPRVIQLALKYIF